MKLRLPPKAQVLVAAAFLALLSLGTVLAYAIQSRAQAALSESLDRDIRVLLTLPILRESLQQSETLTDQYLLTGNPLWLEQRRAALVKIRAARAALAKPELDQAVDEYLEQQERWIGRKAAGRLSSEEASRIAARKRRFDEIAGQVLTVGDISLDALRERHEASRAAGDKALAAILGTSLLAAAVLALLFSRLVMRPMRALYDKERELGEFKSQLVAIVSHEFNNALNILLGVSSLLEDTEGRTTPERRKEFFRMLKANLRMLTIAANNLLNMGRLESGRFAVSTRGTDLVRLLEETHERLGILSQEKKQTITLSMPPEPKPVAADPEALTLVVTNLLSNAIKYTHEGGHITLGFRPEGAAEMRVWCRDDGIGIALEDQQRIFSEYYRAETGQKYAKGFGVGLSLAKKILDAHGATLEVASEVGHGSTFSFRLPVWNDIVEPQ